MKELSLPIFMALASSGDGKFSSLPLLVGSNSIPFGSFLISGANPLPLRNHTSKKGSHKAEEDSWVRVAHMSRNYP